MRYIHNIAGHETFIASGIYTFYTQQSDVRMTEEWSLHQQPDGSQKIRADHDARPINGSSLLVEVYRNTEGTLERFDLHYLGRPSTPIHDVTATYTLMNSYVHMGRTINQGARQYKEIAIPPDTLVFPPAQHFIGEIIAQMTSNPAGTVTIFTPEQDQVEAEHFFTGRLDHWRVEFINKEQLTIAGETLTTHCYQLTTGQPANKADARIWLDADNLLRQAIYTKEEITWQVVLTQYAHRPQR